VSHGTIRTAHTTYAAAVKTIALLHQVGISDYFTRKMHSQTTLKVTCSTVRWHEFSDVLFTHIQGNS